MTFRPERLFVTEDPEGRVALRESGSSQTALVESSSRAEMDMKLAALDLEADWSHPPAAYSVYTIRSLHGSLDSAGA